MHKGKVVAVRLESINVDNPKSYCHTRRKCTWRHMCAHACFRLVHDSGTLPALPTAHSEKPMTLATQMNVCNLLQRSQVSHTAGKLN